ncbi:hypothetical protein EDB80DRAFT_875473 [Ilyonectria destructans]|nr:hypothetical protein EDB80DRAFT_875473 [Ilyonectria destructans]
MAKNIDRLIITTDVLMVMAWETVIHLYVEDPGKAPTMINNMRQTVQKLSLDIPGTVLPQCSAYVIRPRTYDLKLAAHHAADVYAGVAHLRPLGTATQQLTGFIILKNKLMLQLMLV